MDIRIMALLDRKKTRMENGGHLYIQELRDNSEFQKYKKQIYKNRESQK